MTKTVVAVIAVLGLFTFVPFLHGQGSVNYMAKWSSTSTLTSSAVCQSTAGGLIGIATCFPTQRLQVNSGDVLVKGPQNFVAAGNVARYFVGDTNHVIGAAFGAGLYFSTNKIPYAMVLQDLTGFVGIGTSKPTAALSVVTPYSNSLASLSNGVSSFTLDGHGNIRLVGDDYGASFTIPNGLIFAVNVNAEVMSAFQVGATDGNGNGTVMTQSGITFPDGTVQYTACTPTTVAATTKRAVRKVRR